uniref:non-ribosomal peptide synthetase n=1 Tax=Kordia zhangzhouensis TaxID=1620405 RepID=UPI000AB422BF
MNNQTIFSFLQKREAKTPALIYNETEINYSTLWNSIEKKCCEIGNLAGKKVVLAYRNPIAQVVNLLAIIKSGGYAIMTSSKEQLIETCIQTAFQDEKIYLSTDTQETFALKAFQKLSAVTFNENTPSSSQVGGIILVNKTGSEGYQIEAVDIEKHLQEVQSSFGLHLKTKLQASKDLEKTDVLEYILPAIASGVTLYFTDDNTNHKNGVGTLKISKQVASNHKLLQKLAANCTFEVTELIITSDEKISGKCIKKLKQVFKKLEKIIVTLHIQGIHLSIIQTETAFDTKEDTFVNYTKPLGKLNLQILDAKFRAVPLEVSGTLWVESNYFSTPVGVQNSLKEVHVGNHSKQLKALAYKAKFTSNGEIVLQQKSAREIYIDDKLVTPDITEDILKLHNNVIDAAVVYKKSLHCLIAFVELESEGEILGSEFRTWLKRKVNLDNLPSHIEFVSELPKDPYGCINYDELAKKEVTLPSITVTPTQEKLRTIWQELLHISTIELEDNFFELGGHSLLATRMISMIQKQLGIDISITTIFMYPTIKSLSSQVRLAVKKDTLPAISVQEKIGNIPLSFSQERLWFLDQLQGTQDYHISGGLQLKGAVNFEILEASLRAIVERHEILRTVIKSENGIGYQTVQSSENWTLEKGQKNLEQSAQELINSYTIKSFNLSEDYMFRACFFEAENGAHVLACVFHHIASDGWSIQIFAEEFKRIYSALINRSIPTLSPLSFQYADYAIWQRNALTSDFLKEQLTYWHSNLSGVSQLKLPLDNARPFIQNTTGATIKNFKLDSQLSARIYQICKEEGSTVFMFLLSAFKVLLMKYSGQDDICIGTPIANRTQSDLEGMIGFFVNTLALRTDLSGNPTFKELLLRVKNTALGSYEHQLTPFELVVNNIVTTREMNMNPLFQVMFSLEDSLEISDFITDELEVSFLKSDTTTSQFDLSLHVEENKTELSLHIEYSTSLFKKETILRILDHYSSLLEVITKDVSQSIQSLNMISAFEQDILLHKFNATQVEYPKDQTIVALFERQVLKTPDAIAVVYEEETLTYQELDKRSNQLASYLVGQGVESETLVGICIDRSLSMLIGILGILKSGGAYVPIDPDYPEHRINYILSDGKIELILSNSRYASIFTNRATLKTVLLDTNWSDISKYNTGKVSVELSSRQLAYIIYTSGSTGHPKGVMNEHAGVVNRLLWTQSEYGLTRDDVILQKTSFSFDVSVWELFWANICGARLVFSKPDGHKDAEYLKDLIESAGVTTLHFVPSMLRVFLQALSPNDCGTLRRVLCSGEALQLDDVRLFKEKLPGVALSNLYGPTEAAIDVSYWHVPLEEDIDKILIGQPVANTKLYVLGTNQALQPIGVVGELCISGIQVARGYLNRSVLTTEKFIINPFDEGERLYKTGDLARWLPDGNIELLGRKDTQVKIRGYRIELGEIEHALLEHESILNSCVVVKHDCQETSYLVGYVVFEGEFSKASLELFLGSRLPGYMIPKIWVLLEEIPLTTNGKIDRKALPAPDIQLYTSTTYIAPQTAMEKQLAEIWQALLGIDKMGIEENFFELGGHSLLVIQLISALQHYDLQLSVKDIFEYPTIGKLALRLQEQEPAYVVPANGIVDGCNYITPEMVPLLDFEQDHLETIMDLVDGGAENIEDIYPLSPLQEGIYFHYLMSASARGDVYIMPNLLCFSSQAKRAAFLEALSFVINRHDVLRTCVLSAGLPHAVQVVLREVSLSVAPIELEDTKAVAGQLQDYISNHHHRIDVSKAPLLELRTVEDEENQNYYLLLNLHHLMLDHVGLEIIIEEIGQYLSGNAATLPPPSLYRNFIGHVLHTQSLSASESYFKSRFESIESPTLPFGLQDVHGDGVNIVESTVRLSEGLSSRIYRVSQELQMSPATLFHAAFGLVVG